MNKIKRISILLILSAVIFSCKKNSEFIHFESLINLKGEIIDIERPVGNPTKLLIKDSYLIVLDYFKEYNFAIINLENQKLVKRFGKKGKGPQEIQHATCLSTYRNSEKIQVYDTSNKSLFIYDPDSLILFTNYRPYQCSFKNIEFFPYHLKALERNSFLTTGDFTENKFKWIRNNKILDFARYIKLSDKKIPQNVYPLIFQGDFVFHPNGQNIASCSYKFPLIEFYTLEKNGVKLNKRFLECEPKVEPLVTETIQTVSSLEDNKYGFIDLYGTTDYVYALYSGRNSLNHNDKVYSSNVVMVFDWNGTPITKFLLDYDLNCIAVGDDNKFLFGYSVSNEVKLVKFSLNYAITN